MRVLFATQQIDHEPQGTMPLSTQTIQNERNSL